MMTEPSWMATLLDFDRDGEVFLAPQLGVPGMRLFGGLIAAQALGAAGATVDPGKHPQSLHAYFVRGGEFGVDVELEVERTRDGRSFDTRRVTARQHGKVILEMIASFQIPEDGADWHPAREPSVSLEAAVPKTPDLDFATWLELRCDPADVTPFAVPPFWIRSGEPIEDDPLVRACTLTFISDIGPVPAARPPGTPFTPGSGAAFATSLDHSVWFHRPYDPDRWHCYEVDSLGNSHSRGLVAGGFYDATGALIANTSQQALWRL